MLAEQAWKGSISIVVFHQLLRICEFAPINLLWSKWVDTEVENNFTAASIIFAGLHRVAFTNFALPLLQDCFPDSQLLPPFNVFLLFLFDANYFKKSWSTGSWNVLYSFLCLTPCVQRVTRWSCCDCCSFRFFAVVLWSKLVTKGQSTENTGLSLMNDVMVVEHLRLLYWLLPGWIGCLLGVLSSF